MVPPVASRLMRSSNNFVPLLLCLALLGAALAESPCAESQYVDDNGECASCVPFSFTDDVNFIGAASCLCQDDYYLDSLAGLCERCPASTTSMRGGNMNISGCLCDSTWFGTDGECQSCGTGGFSLPPDNTDVSDCECDNGYYGPPGTVGCTRCPDESTSVRGSNALFCSCRNGYWGLGGGNSDNCTMCGDNSFSVKGSNSQISDCVCSKNWYGVNGTCFPCPPNSVSTAGDNSDISSCACKNNWYMVDAGTSGAQCAKCGPNSQSLQGSNDGVSSCVCEANFWGTDGTCTRCTNGVSTPGSNTAQSDCKCRADYYGPGGEEPCERCPGVSTSMQNANSDRNAAISCAFCQAGHYGTAVVGPKSNTNPAPTYESGCTPCSDPQLTSVVGSNNASNDPSQCFCPSTFKFFTNGNDECAECPGNTRLVTAEPGTSPDACVCPNSNWWGPVGEGTERSCTKCEPFSSVPADLNDEITTKVDCLCNKNYWARPGKLCTKCPALSGANKADRYTAQAEVGSTDISDCTCPANFYGPVAKYVPPPAKDQAWPPAEPRAWINEFHFANADLDRDMFIEIAALDNVNVEGFEVVFYSRFRLSFCVFGSCFGTWTKFRQRTSMAFQPTPAGFGYSYTVLDLDWGNFLQWIVDAFSNTYQFGAALIDLDDGTVLEFICFDTDKSLKATDGPAKGKKCLGLPGDLQEDDSTLAGSSIYRTGEGSFPSAFTWAVSSGKNTKGSENAEQHILPSKGFECRKCPVDKPFSVLGQNVLEENCLCSDDYYQNDEGVCVECPRNSVSESPHNIGLASCTCAANMYWDSDKSQCVKCPNDAESTPGENDSIEGCRCGTNWFGTDYNNCQRCKNSGKSVAGDNEDESKCSCGKNWYGENPVDGLQCTECPAGTLTVSHGIGINVLQDSCSCLKNEYGPGYGNCTACPVGTSAKAGANYALGSCSCPDDTYGPGFGECTPCPLNGTSTSLKNIGVYSCQCPAGFAMSFNHFVNGVKQDPTCVPALFCDGVLDMISSKCWKLFNDKSETWGGGEQKCLDWETPASDAFANDPDYFETPGHLASIITREDLTLATQIFDDFGFVKGGGIWTGANDMEADGTWAWSDGSTFTYIPALWGTNEPTNGNAEHDCGLFYENWKEAGTNMFTPLLSDTKCTAKRMALCTKSPNPCISGNNECSLNAECIDRDFGTGYFGYTCECHFGYLDVLGNGTDCQAANVVACNATFADQCDSNSYCHVYHLEPETRICSCPEGMTGDGVGAGGCKKNAYTVRAVLNLPGIMPDVDITNNDKLVKWEYCKESIARLFFDVDTTRPVWFSDAMHHHITGNDVDGFTMTLNGLFETSGDAQAGLAAFNFWANRGVYACSTKIQTPELRRNLGPDDRSLLLVSPGTVLAGTPGVYTWTAGTTDDPIAIAPTGFEVEAVYFNPSCMATGCWVVDIIYTRGSDNFVTFYLPHALRPNGHGQPPLLPGDADLSVDYDYDVIPASDGITDGYDHWYWDWRKSPETTFQPANFPCGSNDYDSSTSPSGNPPMKLTSCCIREFRQTYRPVMSFYTSTADIDTKCPTPTSELLEGPGRPWNTADPGTVNTADPVTVEVISASSIPYDDGLGAPGNDGLFAGLTWSRIDGTGIVDPYIGQYRARVQLDEKELREMAGKLRGTVGVEHTVDTFLGMAEFKATNTKVLDMFNSQTAIHLEKTSFFTVSTHGVNAYTFLEYINLRLVAVYDEDTDPTETVSENGDRTSRTDSSLAAHYIQVTFTLGPQYQPIETGLIPLDSVRVGQGAFFSAAHTDKTMVTPGLFHACQLYDTASLPAQTTLDARVNQTCGPSASMCVSPASIPDQFVVFNIPLGIDWLPAASPTLSAQVFVDLVVSAIDTVASGTPNSGDDPQQMKTTLSASIPVVQGGVNIFCDGITAKTDLVDVVQVDLILGSAATDAELSRLRIFKDIANSDLTPKAASAFESDSIEAGLMTLVVKGDSSYFEGTFGYRVNVEDVITIHIMEPTTTKFDQVKALLETAGEDNQLSTGIDGDGYLLNGAFRFQVDRAQQRAYLEPSAGLLDICSFNPPRPTQNVPFPTTCVIRRDIRRQAYPNRNGAFSTAVEIPAQTTTDRHANSVFFTTFLGDSDYAYDLGAKFSQVVADEYALNGRYLRAFMINPGYEWTPTQTGGQSIFTVSQTIFLFALVNLDENFNDPIAASYSLPDTRVNPNIRRRALLSTTTNTGAGTTAAELTFNTSPKQLLSSALGLTEDRVSVVGVTVEIALSEACEAPEELNAHLTSIMQDLFHQVASDVQQVIVMSNTLDMAGQSCADRRSLKLSRRSSPVAAATEVMVAFPPGQNAYLDLDKLESLPEVRSVSRIDISPKISIGEVPPEATPSGEYDEKNDGGSGNTAIIAGAAGGAGGLLLLGAGALIYSRSRAGPRETEVVQAVNVDDLKASLADDC